MMMRHRNCVASYKDLRMTTPELIAYIDKYGRRADGHIKASMIKRHLWEKIQLSHVYDNIMMHCDHPDATFAQVVCHIVQHLPPKHVCGNPECTNLAKWDKRTSSYLKSCSRACSVKLPDTVDTWRSTNFSRYGDGVYGQCTEAAINKRKETCVARYGSESFSSTDNFRAAMSDNNPMYLPATVERFNQTNLERYGTVYFNSTLVNSKAIVCDPDTFISDVERTSPHNYAIVHSIDANTVYTYLRQYGREDLIGKSVVLGNVTNSKPELILHSVLDELGVTYVKNDRTVISPLELDVYLPEYNAAIEINGIYWHSTASPTARSKDYHFVKWQQCRDKGVSLYSYTDADIYRSLDIIRAKIRYITTQNTQVIGARKCTIGSVTLSQERDFLAQHHVQGFLKARVRTFGAYYNDTLVAVINWAIRPNYLEITRYCCDTYASYPGLFSKMLKFVINATDYNGDIVSFSNNAHSNGNVYKQAGFELAATLGPAYWYTKDFVLLENRQKYMKSKIQKRFGIDTHNATEAQLMEELGYYRYYDSGKIKWIYRRT